MARNRTLGEFDAGDGDDGPDPIEPVVRWAPEGDTCARCGQSTESLWLTEGVAGRCSDCVEW